MNIINADQSNLKDWVELSIKLFPNHIFEEMYHTYEEFLTTKKEIGFLYQYENELVAFMNLSIRNDYVNGTDTSPVVFIEAIYVLPEYRGQGIARKLLEYANEFAKENEITQIASDCLIENTTSELFHKSCGFTETERVIYFVKTV